MPGTSYFADLIRHPENERTPDVVVIRSEGSLLYFNVDYVRDQLLALVRAHAKPPRLVIFFLGNVPYVDLAGAELLVEMNSKFQQHGIAFRLAEVRGEVREALRRLGEGHGSGLAEAHQTVDAVLTRWRESMLVSTAT